ncbi:AC4 protein [Melochia yellow mosaic virus]|uniref:AC4 protein n=1 Tax=Melochia yellow mosaic virus TaxID=1742595 RepID=A0A0P0K7Y7_9GEMI|nr:AC4 protein [Melochia yellow mosaic virus]ALK27184.1 AC4 protein [Melochia yellow mosaic virus]
MESHTSMCCFNLRGKSKSQIIDCSIYLTHNDRLSFTPTSRELNRAPMSSLTSTRTETPLNGVNSKSTAEVLEEVNKRLMMLPPRH